MTKSIKSIKEDLDIIIRERPYYICKRSEDHKDMQSQFGSMMGQYSRREDKLNEEYLIERLSNYLNRMQQNPNVVVVKAQEPIDLSDLLWDKD